MNRLPALGLSLALAACTAGPVSDTLPGEAAARPESPASTLPDVPDKLIAFDEDGVRSALGEPEFVWTEDGAAMWRYRGAGTCFVDVFLYDGRGVTYVDVRGDGLDDATRAACFRDLVTARAAIAAG